MELLWNPGVYIFRVNKHIARMDVMRGVAILGVFFYHFLGVFFDTWTLPWKNGHKDYTNWPFHHDYLLAPLTWGWLGVPLFFVISGFCIHYSFLQRSQIFSVKDFYRRRVLRIYPAYLVSLLFFVALGIAHITSSAKIYDIFAHLFLVHNFFAPTIRSINGAYWSLAFECQIYLFFPLYLLLRRKISSPGCLVAILAIQVLNALATPWIPALAAIHDWPGIFMLPCLEVWILGACLAEAYAEGRRLFRRGLALNIISGVLLLLAVNIQIFSDYAYLFASVFFATILDRYLVGSQVLSWLEDGTARIGIISYSVYLWHQPLMILIHKYLVVEWRWPLDFYWWFFVYLPLCLMVIVPISATSYYWIEKGFSLYLSRNVALKKSSGVTGLMNARERVVSE